MAFDFSTLVPSPGAAANAYERVLQIAAYTAGTAPAEGDWLTVRDKKDFAPQRTPRTEDITTDAHKGGTAVEKIGDDWSASVNVLKNRQQDNDFQDYYKVLRAAAESKGDGAKVHVRYFDGLGADEAYQTVATVQIAEAGSGLDIAAFTFTGSAPIEKIATPVTQTTP